LPAYVKFTKNKIVNRIRYLILFSFFKKAISLQGRK